MLLNTRTLNGYRFNSHALERPVIQTVLLCSTRHEGCYRLLADLWPSPLSLRDEGISHADKSSGSFGVDLQEFAFPWQFSNLVCTSSGTQCIPKALGTWKARLHMPHCVHACGTKFFQTVRFWTKNRVHILSRSSAITKYQLLPKLITVTGCKTCTAQQNKVLKTR